MSLLVQIYCEKCGSTVDAAFVDDPFVCPLCDDLTAELPTIPLVPRPVSIDLSQLTEQQLRWMAEGEAEEAARTEAADVGRV